MPGVTVNYEVRILVYRPTDDIRRLYRRLRGFGFRRDDANMMITGSLMVRPDLGQVRLMMRDVGQPWESFPWRQVWPRAE